MQGNQSTGPVDTTGGKGSALANAGMRVDLAGTAQANGIGLAAMQVRQSQVQVLGNHIARFVAAQAVHWPGGQFATADGDGVGERCSRHPHIGQCPAQNAALPTPGLDIARPIARHAALVARGARKLVV